MIKRFFKLIILKDIFEALWIGFKNCFKKPVTKSLTEIKHSEKFREIIKIDKDKCIKCRLCESICPNKSIRLESGKIPMWNKQKCCYCRLCQKVCPKQAITTKSSEKEK
ncbi:MAG: 4Fe-4S binding protein [Alphaproteobacteria bacterium]|nr:4Fe-4S binding protein [Alphaproteobacteria bacterium]